MKLLRESGAAFLFYPYSELAFKRMSLYDTISWRANMKSAKYNCTSEDLNDSRERMDNIQR